MDALALEMTWHRVAKGAPAGLVAEPFGFPGEVMPGPKRSQSGPLV
ncbi:hypothetical protein [Streptosporangium subroseum]|nr:hypothetical protein OHB15_25615 [Streptosporangium subroseum]